MQQYDTIAIQYLRNLAAADALQIAPGTLLEIVSEYKPVYVTFQANSFDFIAFAYQTTPPTAQASMELVENYQNVRDTLTDEGDVLPFS